MNIVYGIKLKNLDEIDSSTWQFFMQRYDPAMLQKIRECFSYNYGEKAFDDTYIGDCLKEWSYKGHTGITGYLCSVINSNIHYNLFHSQRNLIYINDPNKIQVAVKILSQYLSVLGISVKELSNVALYQERI